MTCGRACTARASVFVCTSVVDVPYVCVTRYSNTVYTHRQATAPSFLLYHLRVTASELELSRAKAVPTPVPCGALASTTFSFKRWLYNHFYFRLSRAKAVPTSVPCGVLASTTFSSGGGSQPLPLSRRWLIPLPSSLTTNQPTQLQLQLDQRCLVRLV